MQKSEYFLAKRSFSFIPLSLSIAASYISASSFLSGPSAVYKWGLAWIFIAIIQIPSIFLSFSITAKPLYEYSLKHSLSTFIDFIHFKYKSKIYTMFSSLVIFSSALVLIVAQLMAGSKIFQFLGSLSYNLSLILFTLFIFLYVAFGGFKLIVISNAIQGFFMILLSLIFFSALLKSGGGFTNLILKVEKINSHLLSFNSGGELSFSYIFSFYVLIGIGLLGLPQVATSYMAFKDKKSINLAILISPLIISLLLILMHFVGFFSIALEPNLKANDKVILFIAKKYLSPLFFTLFIIALLSAIMSTIDTLLLLIISIIFKTLKLVNLNFQISKKTILSVNMVLFCLISFFALSPPDFLLFFNLFALGALEIAFFLPLTFGLYIKSESYLPPLVSAFLSLALYLILIFFKINVFNFHPVLPAFLFSLFLFFLVLLLLHLKNAYK